MPDIKCAVHNCLKNIDGFCCSNDLVEIEESDMYNENPFCITVEYD